MAKILDYERINRALKVLDQLARDNPQYCFQPGTVPWAENLEELKTVLDSKPESIIKCRQI